MKNSLSKKGFWHTPSSELLLIENKIRLLSHYHTFISSNSPNIFK